MIERKLSCERKVTLERIKQQKLWEDREKQKRMERLKEKSKRESKQWLERINRSEKKQKQKKSKVKQFDREIDQDKQNG